MFEENGIESLVVADGFTLSVPFPLVYEADENIILVGTENKSFTVSFGSEGYDGTRPLMDVVDAYLASLEERGWEFSQEEPVDIEVDGSAGIAVDLAGTAVDLEFGGQAIAVSPNPGLVLFGLGVSITELGDWELSGKPTFESLLDRIKFSDQDAACPVSTDQTYGYTESNPVQIGGDSFGGPAREQAYLEHVRGPNGEALAYEREGSIPTETTILDAYKITGPGINETLYLDIYSYTPLQAPVGFTCNGDFPLSTP
jgi:hypothetical protein